MASDATEGTEISVVECRDCVFAWQYPVRRSFEDSVMHADARYANSSHGYYNPDRRKAVAATQVGYFESLRGSKGTLLDVGAGDGALVYEAAVRGWKATGIDPAAPNFSENGGELVRGVISDLGTDEKFDIVSLMDVIEHLELPYEVLAEAARKVDVGGFLVIETGNYQSAGRVEAGSRWWCYAEDHRWYFSPPVVSKWLIELGFDAPSVCNRVLRPDWKGDRRARPWLGGHVRRCLRQPTHILRQLNGYLAQRSVAARGRDWSGLEIFTIAARRPS
jgi:SAM-dependent methyltransferase